MKVFTPASVSVEPPNLVTPPVVEITAFKVTAAELNTTNSGTLELTPVTPVFRLRVPPVPGATVDAEVNASALAANGQG